jgi:uncharacterized membrane protein
MDGLKDFPESKLRDIISNYDNKFSQGLALGKNEEEIIAELGNPNLIVNQYRSEFLDTGDTSTIFDNENNSSTEAENLNIEKLNYEFASDAISTDNASIFTTDANTNTDASRKNDTTSSFIISDNINNVFSSDDANTNLKDNNTFAVDNNFDDQKSFLMTDSNLNDTEYAKPYEDINPNNNFYDLYTNAQPSKNDETNYNNTTSANGNYNSYSNSKPNSSQSTVNLILKICIIGVTLLIFSPVITGIIGCIIGLFGVAISILVGSIGLLVGGTFTSLVGVPNVPLFIANFPYPVIVLFSLGSISLSLFLTLIFYYLCKFFIKLLIKTYRALKLKGGDL